MDRSDPLGVSQFVQDVRFRRGLEGELAQSIMTIDAVDIGARAYRDREVFLVRRQHRRAELGIRRCSA